MSARDIRAASELLIEAWVTGRRVPRFSPEDRPSTVADGWRIQRAVDRALPSRAGWKLGGTSPAGRKNMGTRTPLVGRLYPASIHANDVVIGPPAPSVGIGEPEFAFRMSRDLEVKDGGVIGRDQVIAAIAGVYPALEMPDTRFWDPLDQTLPEMVADALWAGAVVLGPIVEDWSPDSLVGHRVELRLNDVVVQHGRGAEVMGDPVGAVLWLAEYLAARGEYLAAGDLIMAGAATQPVPLAPGDRLEAVFEGLGNVRARLAEVP